MSLNFCEFFGKQYGEKWKAEHLCRIGKSKNSLRYLGEAMSPWP